MRTVNDVLEDRYPFWYIGILSAIKLSGSFYYTHCVILIPLSIVLLCSRVHQENALMKMNRSVSFTQFIKNDKNFKSRTPELKLQSIFFLFDNNDEGILRKHEVRQIIFTLFLLKKEPVKVKVII